MQIPVFQFGKKKRARYEGDCIEVDEMLSLALCIDSGVWKKKDSAEIEYQSTVLNPDYLFPEKSSSALPPGFVKEEGEEDEDEDEDEVEQPAKKVAKKSKTTVRKRKEPRQRKAKQENNENKETFNCDKCGKSYTNSTLYYSHVEKVCAVKLEVKCREEEGKFFCSFDLCPKKEQAYGSKLALENHWANAHVEKKDKIIPCFMCDRRFATSAAKKEHLARDHTKSHKCDHCEEKFLTEGLLKKHLKTHNDVIKKKQQGEPTRNYLCLKCGQAMTQEYGKKHEAKCNGQRVRHPEYKKIDGELWCTVYGCKLGYGFQSEYGLRKHFHDKHIREDEKYFACDYCDEKFSFNTTRNRHMRLKHLKSHVCDICGRGFGTNDKLNKHRMVHTGEKPHACDKCDYRTSNRSNLHAHKLSRHGDVPQKNFLCTLCNKQFTTMGRVHRHMTVAHGGDGQDEAMDRKKPAPKKPNTTTFFATPSTGILQQPKQRRGQKRIQYSTAAAAATPTVATTQVVQHHEIIQAEHPVQTVNAEEQEAAVHFLQQQLEGPNGTVITVTPLQ